MYRKFKVAVIAGALLATLAACVTTGLKPGEMPSMSREEATKLQAPVYSVDIAANNGPAAKKALRDAFMRIYNNTPTDTRYGNPRIIEETERGFRIRSNRAAATIGVRQPPDIEIVFFLEEIPGQPAQARANTYFVAIQNPGADERRFSYANVGAMSEDGNKRIMDHILPQLQRGASNQSGDFLPKPPTQPVAVRPARSADMIALEKPFLAGDWEGVRKQAQPMADAGNSVAQCAMAYVNFIGLGGPKNPESGQQWLSKALAANDVVCRGAAEFYGWGRAQNSRAGVESLRPSAEAGDVHAMFVMGWVAQSVAASDRNWLVAAAQLYSAAAKLGLNGVERHLDPLLATLSDEERSRVNSYTSQWSKL